MVTLFIMVGISGSGKSTYAEKVVKDLQLKGSTAIIIATDDIRAEICGNASDQSKNREVFELGYARLDETLKSGRNAIWDATNLSREDRRKPVAIGKANNAHIVAIEMMTPLTISIERNKGRERVVPTPVIWKQQGKYYPVTKNEVDTVITINLENSSMY